ncbi:hypothetical protein VZT92_024866 [Zoarces viviparus]|uniref:Uncharacterized protein n=1 Tax=Zoarces viviparus TaxID=48416 RepID=A0AAW1E341_ZOAVI
MLRTSTLKPDPKRTLPPSPFTSTEDKNYVFCMDQWTVPTGKPDLVEGKDNSHNKTGMERGSWYPIAETERSFPSATPKTYSLFHTFQEKYMKTIQPNVNK